MVDTAFFGVHDYDGEPSGFSINVAEITGDVAALTTAIATLRTATDGIILGSIDKTGFTDITFDTPSVNNTPFSQRETKWQVIVIDSNGKKYAANEIPMADLSILENNSPYIVKGGSVVVVAAATAVQAWVDAFEALARSSSDLALTVWDVYHVGRNV